MPDACRFPTPKLNELINASGSRSARDGWLEGKSCVVCGSTDRLEIDHIDPQTKDPKLKGDAGTGRMWSWSAERRAAELAKIQVPCHEHHLEKTIAERPVLTECPQGHKFVDGSFYVRADGVKKCRECNRERMRLSRAAKDT